MFYSKAPFLPYGRAAAALCYECNLNLEALLIDRAKRCIFGAFYIMHFVKLKMLMRQPGTLHGAIAKMTLHECLVLFENGTHDIKDPFALTNHLSLMTITREEALLKEAGRQKT